jgi:uncharacterized membrane protein YfcA
MQGPPPPTEQSKGNMPQEPSSSNRSTAPRVSAIYALIGWVLQGGVLLSAAVIVLGLLLELLQPNKFASQKLQDFPQTFDQIWAGLLVLRPQAVIALGLLLGALVGARVLARLSNHFLRLLFLAVIVVAAVEMVLHGLGIA